MKFFFLIFFSHLFFLIFFLIFFLFFFSSFALGTATGNLLRHITVNHKLELDRKKQSLQKISSILFPTTTPRQPKADAKYILARRIVLDLCCRSLVPFHIVEKKGFQDFLLRNNIVTKIDQIPSSNALSVRALLDVHQMVQDSVVKRISSECPSVMVIMADAWTDGHAHIPYVNVSTQYLTLDFKMRDWNLGTEPLERPHSAENLKNLVESLLEKHGLEQKKLICVSDNASNMKLMAKKLRAVDFCGCEGHNLHLFVMSDTIRAPGHDEFRFLISKIKKIHKALSFKINDMKQQSIKDKNEKLAIYLEQLEFTIGKFIFIYTFVYN